MGYAGNLEPSHIFPTVIATCQEKQTNPKNKKFNDHLDFFIGDEAIKNASTH